MIQFTDEQRAYLKTTPHYTKDRWVELTDEQREQLGTNLRYYRYDRIETPASD